MSDAKEKKGDKGDAEAPAPAKGGSKVLVILVAVNSLLLLGVMGFLGLQLKQLQHPAAAAEEHAAKGEEKKPEKGEAKEEKGEEKAPEKGEGKEEGGKGEGGGSKSGGVLVKIPDFVVHLRNPDADRYARVSFEVEVMADSDKERLQASSARVRDAFIGYLSDRTLEDLRGSEGLSRTKEALQTNLRQLLPDVRIRALYISDFVVQ